MGDETLQYQDEINLKRDLYGEHIARLDVILDQLRSKKFMQRDRSDDLKTRLSSSFVGESVRVLEHALLGDERLDQQGGNMAVLITEPAHDRFRQMGRRRYHDWQEYGVVGTDFSDGGHARLPDGLCGTPRVMEQFYAFDNHTGQLFDIIGAGPRHMQIRYFQMGGELGVLKLDYKVLFHQELPTFEASR